MISYAQNWEDVILARVFRGQTKGFYVDVGAMDPTLHSVTKHFYDSGWCGINIEPNPAFHAKLVAERPRDRSFPYCLSDRAEVITFHLFQDEGISTLDPSIAEHFQSRQYLPQTLQSYTQTLADVLAEAPSVIDFLKVDVEGWELQVLRGNDWSKHRPIIVLVEALDPRTFAPSWTSWDPELTQNGYKFVYFDGLNRFYLREDRMDLQECFSAPPNVFDNADPFSLIECRNQLAQLKGENAGLQSLQEAAQQALASEMASKEKQAQWAADVASQHAEMGRERDALRLRVDELWALRQQDQQVIEDCSTKLAAEQNGRVQDRETSGSRLEQLSAELAAQLRRIEELSQENIVQIGRCEEFARELGNRDSLMEQEQHIISNLQAELAAEQDTVKALRVDLQAAQQQVEQETTENQRLSREYRTQRLWAGQLAQEKAEAVIRLRKLQQ